MKIELLYYRTEKQFQVYRRCAQAFANRGISLRFIFDRFPSNQSDADLFVIQLGLPAQATYGTREEAFDRLAKLERPIIFEDDNASSIPHRRSFIKLPNLLRIYRTAVARPEIINLQVDRYHFWLIGTQPEKPNLPALTKEDISKIRPGIHLGMYDRMKLWITSPNESKWSTRPIDVLFIGRVLGRGAEHHRLNFVKALDAIRGLRIICVPERNLSPGEYQEIARKSKIIISPWGDSEMCYREFEGMLDECVVIKPRSDFMRTLDDILTPEETYVPCKPDASDLEDVICRVLASDRYSDPGRLARNRQRVLDWWNPEKIVDWWCSELPGTLCKN